MFASPWIRKPDFKNVGKIDYDSYWEHRGWKVQKNLRSREQIILSMIPKGLKVIDIGCGNSKLPVALKEKGVHVEVADISPLVLEGYKKFDIRGKVLNLTNITKDTLDESYDYIVMSEVLEHTANPEEIIDMLKPHTRHFILTVPNSAAYFFRYGLLVRGRFFTQWVHHPSEHLRYWSHLDFLDWLEAQGLEVIESPVSDGFTLRGLMPFLPKLWKNFLAFRMVYRCRVPEDEVRTALK